MELTKGTKIPLELGGCAEILGKIGSGGQGGVYKVSYNGREYALKWYGKMKNPEGFRRNLLDNINDGVTSECFLWPKYATTVVDGSFGYLMELKPQSFSAFPDILNAKARFADLYAIVNAAINICCAFRELHNCGKSYQDMNDGGFFVDTATGDVLICDCDNTAPYGENLGIAGKPGYMAPEIVRGEQKPNKETDRYSLAVILFKLLLRGDPLEGKKVLRSVCLTEAAERKHYGFEPVFVYDPDNDTNRPVRGVHNNILKFWGVFPEYIRSAFIRSFTVGLSQPSERVLEKDWLALLTRLRGDIITCSCGRQNFLTAMLGADDSFHCSCGLSFPAPLVLKYAKTETALFPKSRVYGCSDNIRQIGEVVQNKLNPSLWGIKNLTASEWRFRLPNGQEKSAVPNSAVPVFNGTEIDFGSDKAVIQQHVV